MPSRSTPQRSTLLQLEALETREVFNGTDLGVGTTLDTFPTVDISGGTVVLQGANGQTASIRPFQGAGQSLFANLVDTTGDDVPELVVTGLVDRDLQTRDDNRYRMAIYDLATLAPVSSIWTQRALFAAGTGDYGRARVFVSEVRPGSAGDEVVARVALPTGVFWEQIFSAQTGRLLSSQILTAKTLTDPAPLVVTNWQETGVGTLPSAIQQAGQDPWSDWTISLNVNTPILLTEQQILSFKNLTINGNGATIDMKKQDRAFFVAGGTITINNLTIQNGKAKGGDGQDGGGGGAGLGGAIFATNLVRQNVPGTFLFNQTNMTLNKVTLKSNEAEGGKGGDYATKLIPGPILSFRSTGGGGGGGGMGGNGGVSADDNSGRVDSKDNHSAAGGGGIGNNAHGGNGVSKPSTAEAATIPGAPGALQLGIQHALPAANSPFPGGDFGGGGAGIDDQLSYAAGGGPSSTFVFPPDNGNWGGGGGGAYLFAGGNGGFGGGGGGSHKSHTAIGGNGGFGGGAGVGTGGAGSPGQFGGKGEYKKVTDEGSGGGGAGLGGGLFVDQFATVTLIDTIFGGAILGERDPLAANKTAGGRASPGGELVGATAGGAAGSDLFLRGPVTINAGTSFLTASMKLYDSIADDPNSPGQLIKTGAGTLDLLGNNSQLHGGVNLREGRINIQDENSLGSGTLTSFGSVVMGIAGEVLTPRTLILPNPIRIGGPSASLRFDLPKDVALSLNNVLATTQGGQLAKSGAGVLDLLYQQSQPALSLLVSGGELNLNATGDSFVGSLTIQRDVTSADPAPTFTWGNYLLSMQNLIGNGTLKLINNASIKAFTASNFSGTLSVETDAAINLPSAGGKLSILTNASVGVAASAKFDVGGAGMLQLNRTSPVGATLSGRFTDFTGSLVVASDWTINQEILKASNVTLSSGSKLTAQSSIGSPITGQGTLVANPGTGNSLKLSNLSGFQGTLTVASGKVTVDGAIPAGVTVNLQAGATLVVTGSFQGRLTGQGLLRSQGQAVTVAGDMTAFQGSFIIDGGATLTASIGTATNSPKLPQIQVTLTDGSRLDVSDTEANLQFIQGSNLDRGALRFSGNSFDLQVSLSGFAGTLDLLSGNVTVIDSMPANLSTTLADNTYLILQNSNHSGRLSGTGRLVVASDPTANTPTIGGDLSAFAGRFDFSSASARLTSDLPRALGVTLLSPKSTLEITGSVAAPIYGEISDRVIANPGAGKTIEFSNQVAVPVQVSSGTLVASGTLMPNLPAIVNSGASLIVRGTANSTVLGGSGLVEIDVGTGNSVTLPSLGAFNNFQGTINLRSGSLLLPNGSDDNRVSYTLWQSTHLITQDSVAGLIRSKDPGAGTVQLLQGVDDPMSLLVGGFTGDLVLDPNADVRASGSVSARTISLGNNARLELSVNLNSTQQVSGTGTLAVRTTTQTDNFRPGLANFQGTLSVSVGSSAVNSLQLASGLPAGVKLMLDNSFGPVEVRTSGSIAGGISGAGILTVLPQATATLNFVTDKVRLNVGQSARVTVTSATFAPPRLTVGQGATLTTQAVQLTSTQQVIVADLGKNSVWKATTIFLANGNRLVAYDGGTEIDAAKFDNAGTIIGPPLDAGTILSRPKLFIYAVYNNFSGQGTYEGNVRFSPPRNG
ncbi:MAG: hypothetical protein U0792_18485 [Gemmataceae bacterium]